MHTMKCTENINRYLQYMNINQQPVDPPPPPIDINHQPDRVLDEV